MSVKLKKIIRIIMIWNWCRQIRLYKRWLKCVFWIYSILLTILFIFIFLIRIWILR